MPMMKKILSFIKNNKTMQKIVILFGKDAGMWKHSAVLGLLIAISTVLGIWLGEKQRTFRTIPELGWMILQILALSIGITLVVKLLLAFLARMWDGEVRSRIEQKEYRDWQVFLFYTGIIFACWLPVFLAYYPSVFAYDAEGQLYQVLAHDYSTHHPLVHTLFLGFFFNLGGNLLGSYSTGMAVHSIVQMLLMAMIFGYALLILYQEKTSWVMRVILLIFYAIFPTNSILALSTTKDVLFSGLVLLFTIKMYQWSRTLFNHDSQVIESEDSQGNQKKKVGFIISFTLISVLMLLFRNNAVYAYLGSLPFVFYVWRKSLKTNQCAKDDTQNNQDRKRNRRKKAVQGAGIVLVTLALFAVCSSGLKTVTAAHDGSPREMLSVPLQQMARTRVQHEEEIDSAMRTELDSYISSEWVFAAYNPYLADPVKNRAVIHDNPVGLIKTWIQLGLQFPMTYVDAFLDNSIGYWYLADKSHSTIYGVGTESGFGYLSTDNRTMPAGCEIIESSFLPQLRVFMEKIVSDNEYQKIPVVSVIFAPAFYWWLLCLYVAFFLSRKEYKMLLPILFLVIYYLTLLLSPTVLIRYMYPFVVSVPMMLCLVSAKKGKETKCNHKK